MNAAYPPISGARPPVGDNGFRGRSGPYVRHVSGASYRQVDYWARTGLLVPKMNNAGCGSVREYEEWQVKAARFLCYAASILGRSSRTLATGIVNAVQNDPSRDEISLTTKDGLMDITIRLSSDAANR